MKSTLIFTAVGAIIVIIAVIIIKSLYGYYQAIPGAGYYAMLIVGTVIGLSRIIQNVMAKDIGRYTKYSLDALSGMSIVVVILLIAGFFQINVGCC